MSVAPTRLGIIDGCQRLLRLTLTPECPPAEARTAFVSKVLQEAFPTRIHDKTLHRKVVAIKRQLEKAASRNPGAMAATHSDLSKERDAEIASLQHAIVEACHKKGITLPDDCRSEILASDEPSPVNFTRVADRSSTPEIEQPLDLVFSDDVPVAQTASSVDALSLSIIDGQTSHGRLTRLDDQTWGYAVPEGVDSSFEEIRIQVPKTYKGKDAYRVAKAIANLFDTKIERLREAVLKTGMNIPIDVEDPALSGTWHIGIPTPKGIVQQAVATVTDAVTGFIPFTRPLKNRKVVVIDVEKVPAAKKVASVALPIILRPTAHTIGGTSTDVISSNTQDRLKVASFQDPFTSLATDCFQKYESFFVMEAEHRGSYRFVINEEGKIRLEENIATKEGYADENRKAVTAYVAFLTKEYGASYVSQLQTSYNISFETMLREGMPLLPDHVSKCNIGVNSIEIHHVEEMKDQLRKLTSELQHLSTDADWDQRKNLLARDFLAQIIDGHAEVSLAVREARGLLRSMSRKEPTVEDLLFYLKTLLLSTCESVRDLKPEAFNSIVSMIMPTDAELDDAFTGRKIRHLTVMGFHTMGDANTPNPCRDQFELLHVFSECRKTNDWKNYYELLTHVVAKKSLFRKTPDTENSWHVGLLIPAPDSKTGEARWYSNDAFYDDHSGNVNYILLPACRGYRSAEGKPHPMIKLYRSTCSNSSSVNWQDSVAADLYPYGSPQSIYPDASSEYERRYIRERTIPVWMGYLVAARKMDLWSEGDTEIYEDRMAKAGRGFLAYLKMTSQDYVVDCEEIERMIADGDFGNLQRLLTQYGHRFKEDPEYKLPQDMVFAGHSLGGALAQNGMWKFLSHEGRMPLPGADVTCYSSDGPAIDASADAEFMAFGREHRKLMAENKSRTHVIHQFEYGDFVPQAGGTHLGTTGFNEAKEAAWLDFSASIFRPLEDTARAPAIVNPGTAHARRIGLATDGVDYTLTSLTSKDLWDYHQTYFLRGRLAQAFGYKILRSPKVAEAYRREIGYMVRPWMKFYQWWAGNQLGSRDANGVFTIDDGRHAHELPVIV